jgi:UDP:flavonoid glycosyltransferase YjiC (YdhE family)
MKIVIPTIGSRGDVQPFIALAQGLMKAGYKVTVASHPVMRSLVESHGVAYSPIGPKTNFAEEVAAIRQQARNSIVGLIQGMRFGFKMLERSHEDILALCKDADLVVVPTSIAAGKNEAELLGIPYLSVNLMPWGIPWGHPQRSIFKRLGYGIMDGLIHMITTLPLNRIRKRQGLPPVGKEGFTSKRLDLVPISPAVFPPNPLWEPHHQMVGYWFAEMPQTWDPPDDLLTFLDHDDPPVLISLGAMSLGDGDALESASLFVEAIQQAEIRAIIQGWETGIRQLTLPTNIYAAGSIPHSWLLSHCAGIVHHGGFGTTAAGFRAGIPTLVIPHMVDQFYWGQQVRELGVGPKAIPCPKLDRQGLATALDDLIQNEEMKTTAAALGEQIRAENGIQNAVQLIEKTFT